MSQYPIKRIEKGVIMTLLSTHKHNYKRLNKKQLIEIVEEQLRILKMRSAQNEYVPSNTIRNNNRRALRSFLKKRHGSNYKDKIAEKIKILRGIK